MATDDPLNSLTINWNPIDISLADLKILTSYVADIYEEAAQPWASNKLSSVPGSPLVTAIRMESPLIAELASHVGDGPAGVLTLGAIGYFIKHPEVLGGWVARFRGASYRDRTQALIEKSEYLRAKAEIAAHGDPIEVFESAAASDLQMISTSPVPDLGTVPESGTEPDPYIVPDLPPPVPWHRFRPSLDTEPEGPDTEPEGPDITPIM